MRARVTSVDNFRKFSSAMSLKRHGVGNNTICLWVIARVSPQKTWVIARVNPQAWVIAQWFFSCTCG